MVAVVGAAVVGAAGLHNSPPPAAFKTDGHLPSIPAMSLHSFSFS